MSRDPLAHELRDVDVGLGRDLAGHDDEPVVISVSQATRPSGSSAQDGVENRVGDLVGDLVGVAFGDRLGGEEELARRHSAEG